MHLEYMKVSLKAVEKIMFDKTAMAKVERITLNCVLRPTQFLKRDQGRGDGGVKRPVRG